MALVLADRVRETTTTTGTGTISLAGPVSGFQGFSTAIGNANTTYYTIVDAATGAWEVGLGTYTSSGSTLARTTVLSSSNSDALVSFGAGTKDVFVTQPAERAVYVLGAGTGLAAGAAAFTANGLPYADSTSTLATSSNLTFNGTTLTANALTTTSTVTINGGTANGVAYLNGSKVLTTGSALTFDGTSLGVGAATPIAVSGYSVIRINGSTGGLLELTSGNTRVLQIQSDGASAGAQITTVNNGSNPPLIFGVNSAEQMRLTSTGLGIGTSSPDAKLDVTSAGSAAAYTVSAVIQDATYPASGNPTLEFNGFIGGNSYRAGIGSIGGQQLAFYTPSTFGVAPTRQMTLNESGNLGIGTSSPSNKLVVSNAGANGFEFDPANGIMQTYNRSTAAYTATNLLALQINFKTGSSPATTMTLDSSGNLGLGVTPSAWGSGIKSVQVGNYSALTNSQGGYTWLSNNAFYDTAWKYLTTNRALYYAQDTASGAHQWLNAPSGTAGNAITFTQAMTLDASGNLLVGQTSTLRGASGRGAIEVNGSSSSVISLNRGGSAGGYIFSQSGEMRVAQGENAPLTFFTNDTERARITSAGAFIVGDTAVVASGFAGVKFDGASYNGLGLNDSAAANTAGYIYFQSAGTTIGSITRVGATSAVAYNTVSDQRLKENIQDAAPASSLIDSLQVRQYKWKSDGSHQRYGFIAQELVTVAPEAVHQPTDPDEMMAVDYSKLVPMLVKEIQSLRQRVAQLEGNQP